MLKEFLGEFWLYALIVFVSGSVVIGLLYLFDTKPERSPKEANSALRKLLIPMFTLALIMGTVRALFATL